MAFENLNPREREVLQNLIDHYVATADPVGSRVIATKFGMGLSSATIRNTMQDLEDMGFISQPHTSAGRIPTDIGYRLYVDSLLKPESLSAAERKKIRSSLFGSGKSVDAILGQSTRALADIAMQMGVTIAPRFDEGTLTRLELVPLNSDRALVVLVVKSGLARSVILEVEATLPEEEMRTLEQILNEKLCGLTLGEISRTITSRLANVTGNARLLKLFIDPDSGIWEGVSDTQLHVVGAENLLGQPEFADREQLVQFVRTLENQEKLSQELNCGNGDGAEAPGVIVKIGDENNLKEMKRCSVVSANYKVGSIEGKIAVIGPTRMRYSKLLSMVEYAAKSISESLSDSSETKT
jgi:heat-inducible transcriptional repressor